MVIAPVDQDDLGIRVLESARRGDAGEATSNDHDAFLRSRLFCAGRVCGGVSGSGRPHPCPAGHAGPAHARGSVREDSREAFTGETVAETMTAMRASPCVDIRSL